MSGNNKDAKRLKPEDHRCQHCGRLLARVRLVPGSYIEIRCPKCSRMYAYQEVLVDSVQEMVILDSVE